MFKAMWRLFCGANKAAENRRGTKRRLRFEQYEDRRMLSASADILFLIDESGSEQNTYTQDWIATIVDDLHGALTNAEITARYGLVGFGQNAPGGWGQVAPLGGWGQVAQHSLRYPKT